jgi:hypothetical protein
MRSPFVCVPIVALISAIFANDAFAQNSITIDICLQGMATQTMNALHPNSKVCIRCRCPSVFCWLVDVAAGGELRIVYIYGLSHSGVCVLGHVYCSIGCDRCGRFLPCTGGAWLYVSCTQIVLHRASPAACPHLSLSQIFSCRFSSPGFTANLGLSH